MARPTKASDVFALGRTFSHVSDGQALLIKGITIVGKTYKFALSVRGGSLEELYNSVDAPTVAAWLGQHDTWVLAVSDSRIGTR
jgi:hypothetical protein